MYVSAKVLPISCNDVKLKKDKSMQHKIYLTKDHYLFYLSNFVIFLTGIESHIDKIFDILTEESLEWQFHQQKILWEIVS